MKSIIFILAFVALAAAAPKATKLLFKNLFKTPSHEFKARPNPHIIGGQEAEPHSIPYQVYMEVYTNRGGWYCGGTLISENYILTAAYCVDGSIVKSFVILGAHRPLTSEDTQVNVEIANVTVHHGWDPMVNVDNIAVVQLSEPVTLTDAIQVVALPRRSDEDNDFVGETARISGWGLTDGYDENISDVLNYVDVTVISNDDCGIAFADLVESHICTSGDDNASSCNGDTGGPLVSNDVQIGIVSFHISLCYGGYPSGFTRVTSYLDWIEEFTDVQIQ